MKRTLVKPAVLATCAALAVAAAALTTSITSAQAKGPGVSHGYSGARGGTAFKSGSSGPHVGMSPSSNFRSAAGAQYRTGQVGRQFNSGQISRQFSGQVRSSQAFSGQIHNNGARHVARRHVRGGPGFFAYGPGYSDYGYEYYPYADDDDCYAIQRVWRHGTWQYVRVYVCE